MTYRIVLTSKSELQLAEAALWWSENRDAVQAARWLEKFEETLATLAQNPQKHGVIHETAIYDFPHTVRQLPFGLGRKPTHRAVFEIRGETVYVVAVHHLAQRDLLPEDI